MLYAFQTMGIGRLWLIIAVIALLCAMTCAHITPLITGYAVDSVIGERESNLPSWLQSTVDDLGGRSFFIRHFWILPLAVVLCALINGLFIFIRGKFMTAASEEFA